jgi:hypothetical protein
MNPASYGITIDPVGLTGNAAATYKYKVGEHLLWIYRTITGKILFNSIKFHKVPVIIRPYTAGDCNALAGAETVGGVFRAYVEYSPNTFSLHGACPANTSAQKSGLLWDEILFHEMVHAFRRVSRKHNRAALNLGLHRYTSNEEFYAVMVTNIYISDRSNKIKSGLRADHQGFRPLAPELDEGFEFFSAGRQVFGLVEQFWNDHPGFSKRVAIDAYEAPFNPLADYNINKDKARRLSEEAGHRDLAGLIEQILGR